MKGLAILCSFLSMVALSSAVQCHFNGKTYPEGSFKDNPCQPCFCSSTGEVHCAIVDCFFAACVDPVHNASQCCPTCPNGPNCRAPDGTTIKQGATYNPTPDTFCSCPRFGTAAICATALKPVTASIVS